MNYRGDKRDQLPPGTRLGPDADGIMHEVTDVAYDESTGVTRIRTRKLEIADHRLRFVGGGQ